MPIDLPLPLKVKHIYKLVRVFLHFFALLVLKDSAPILLQQLTSRCVQSRLSARPDSLLRDVFSLQFPATKSNTVGVTEGKYFSASRSEGNLSASVI